MNVLMHTAVGEQIGALSQPEAQAMRALLAVIDQAETVEELLSSRFFRPLRGDSANLVARYGPVRLLCRLVVDDDQTTVAILSMLVSGHRRVLRKTPGAEYAVAGR